MSNRIHLDSREWERQHKEKLARKYDRIQGLRALLEEWETSPNYDHAYVLSLRAKLRSAENQLAAMTI